MRACGVRTVKNAGFLSLSALLSLAGKYTCLNTVRPVRYCFYNKTARETNLHANLPEQNKKLRLHFTRIDSHEASLLRLENYASGVHFARAEKPSKFREEFKFSKFADNKNIPI